MLAQFDGVPVKSFKRNRDGNKSVVFEDEYKEKTYKWPEDFKGSKGILVRTGKRSGITVIDFDNSETVTYFLQFIEAEELTDVCDYIVRTYKGFHLYFEYNESIPSLRVHKGEIQIDVQNDDKGVFHPPTPGYSVVKKGKLLPMSDKVKDFILHMSDVSEAGKSDNNYNPPADWKEEIKYFYNFQSLQKLQQLLNPTNLKDLKSHPELINLLTPKSVKWDILNPPKGEGSNTLIAVAGKLCICPYISNEMLEQTILAINASWAHPMDKKRLYETIINPTLKKNIYVNLTDTYNTLFQEHNIYPMFNLLDKSYYVYDGNMNRLIEAIGSETKFVKLLSRLCKGSKLTSDVLNYLPNVEIVNEPTDMNKFTMRQGQIVFNSYIASNAKLRMVQLVQSRSAQNVNCPPLIDYLVRNLYKDYADEHYHKLAHQLFTGEKRTTIDYIYTAQGSGKRLYFHEVMKMLFGDWNIAPNIDIARLSNQQFNSWLLNKELVILNEFTDNYNEQKKAIQHLKNLTETEVYIERKGVDAVKQTITATFVFTVNYALKYLESDSDRRMNVMEHSPIPLQKQPEWVELTKPYNSERDLVKALHEEVEQYVEFLAYIIQSKGVMNYWEYNAIARTKQREKLEDKISKSYSYIAEKLKKQDWQEIVEEALSGPDVMDLMADYNRAAQWKYFTYDNFDNVVEDIEDSFKAGYIHRDFLLLICRSLLQAPHLTTKTMNREFDIVGLDTKHKYVNENNSRISPNQQSKSWVGAVLPWYLDKRK